MTKLFLGLDSGGFFSSFGKLHTKTCLYQAPDNEILTIFIMIAVIDLGGHQALVQKGDKLRIDKLDVEAGKKTSFPVLMVSEPDGKNFQMGTPVLEGVSVEAKVIAHDKDEKIKVFKMKPRKRYRRTYGHRSHKTEIEIVEIKTGAASTKTAEKKEEKPATAKKEAAAPAKKAPAAKKSTTKKAE